MRGLKAIGVLSEGGGVLKSSDTFVSHCRAIIDLGFPGGAVVKNLTASVRGC